MLRLGRVLCVACLACAACSRAPAAVVEVVDAAPDAASAAIVASAAVVPSAVSGDAARGDALGGASGDASADGDFEMVENIEMVPYCLPYPSAYMKPDTSERWEHGRKVFVRKTPAGARIKPSKMELSGSCGERSLEQIYKADLKSITTDTPGAAISVSSLGPSSFAISWRDGDRIHYGKMWVAKGDPGCFVRATFDYDVSERAAFDKIITRVAAASPACPVK